MRPTDSCRNPQPNADAAAQAQSVQRAAAAEAPAVTGGPQSPEALDELAGRLYDRLRARLRDELLIDRERAGLLTDVR